MDPFALIVMVAFAVGFAVFVLLGRLASRRAVADITDKGRNRALGAQAEIEDADLPQMVDAANAYRRRQGMPEVTLEQVRAKVGREQLALLDEANREARRRAVLERRRGARDTIPDQPGPQGAGERTG